MENLGIEDLTAFMKLDRAKLLKRRNCGRKTANEILQLQADIDRFACELADKPDGFRADQLLAAPCLARITTSDTSVENVKGVLADVDNPAPWLTEWVRSLCRSNRQAHAFMLRKGMLGLAPMTLERVGEQVGGVSRERVRQMERALEKRLRHSYHQRRLRPLIYMATATVKQRGGMVTLDELTKAVLCRGENGDQLMFATELIKFFSKLQVWKDCGLVLQKDGVVAGGNSRPLILRLASVLEEVASAVADERHGFDLWSVGRERLKKGLGERAAIVSGTSQLGNLSDALLDAVLKLCRKRVKTHKDRVYSLGLWRLKFSNLIQMLDTVLQELGKPAHFSEIAEHASKWRPDLLARNVHATLNRSNNALLWDRGTFVHKDNVVVPISLIHDVERWLLDVLTEDVPLVSIYGAFLHFRTRCEAAGFSSEIALYTCLRQSAHPELVYPHVPYVYLKKAFTESIPIPVVFENFLLDAYGPVSNQE